jgi:hypothetical protein
MADPNVGVLLSTTLKNYQKKLVDNIHKSNAVFYMLKEMGAIKKESGGERIVRPLMYGKNTTTASYSGYDILDTTPQAGIDSAEYNWKQYSASITISGEEQRKNKGSKHKIIDLLEAKTKQAEMSLTEALTEGLFSDGTGNGSKDLTGLSAMVAASGTYGGIDSSTYTWWVSDVDTTNEALALNDMRNSFNDASKGGKDTPTLIVCSQNIFEQYEGFFTQVGSTNVYGSFNTPSAGTKKLADGGFQTLAYKGVPLVWDEYCALGDIYYLNLNHMDLTVHEDANFATTEFVKPENQDALVAQILFMGNLTCDRRSSHSKQENRDA